MKNALRSAAILFAALIAAGDDCRSEGFSGSGVQSQGEAVLERKPEIMRMSVDLLAKGDTLVDAVAKMKARRAKAERELAALGVTKDSLKFGEIRLDQKQKNRRKQLQMLLNQRMGERIPRDNEKDALAEPIPVDLTMNLTAEWPISDTEPSENFLTVHKLQENIRAANIGGSEDPNDLSEEAADLIEELGGMVGNQVTILSAYTGEFENPGEQKPGEPSFLFVAKISDADRQQALSQAFLAAKANATQLAHAANVGLGPLKNLSNSNGIDASEVSEDQIAIYASQLYGSSLRQQLLGRNSAREAIGTTLGVLKYKVTVNATFEFQ